MHAIRSQPPDTTTDTHYPDQLEPLVQRLAQQAGASDVEGGFPDAEFGWLAAAGLLALTLPGEPLDFARPQTARLLHLLKRIGAGNLAVGRVYEGHLNALYLIHLFATPAQRARWFADVQQHDRLFSVWNTQAQDGVRIRTIAPGRYRLDGCKTFCSGADRVQRPLITADWTDADRRGWQMCIVPTEQPRPIPQDAQFWQPLGMRASASFKLDFTGIELTDNDLLGPPDAYYRQPYFGGGAIRFAAVQLGGAEALFDATRAFLATMHRTDDVMQQARLAEMACLIESGNQWLRAAGEKTDAWRQTNADPVQTVTYANMTRTAIEQICLSMMPLAERCVGARGLLRPLPFERIHRDLTMYLRQPAPDATRLDIGRYALNHHTTRADDLWQ
jgi:alkylation response protein AidB-like acyl-CoA dehydrogenase